MLSLTVVVFPTRPKSLLQAYRFDAVSSPRLIVMVRPKSRSRAHNFCLRSNEDGPLSIIQRVTQTINFVLHISQALVGRGAALGFPLKTHFSCSS